MTSAQETGTVAILKGIYSMNLIAPAVFYLFLTPAASWAAPAPERINEIRAIASQVGNGPLFAEVDILVNTKLEMPAASFQLDPSKFVIQYNPNIMATLSESARDFIFYHELGHIRLGHVGSPYPGAEAAKDLELEADAFATLLFKLRRPDRLTELREFIQFIRARHWTVPTGPERADLCESLLN